jgi:hypothetical protein
MRIICGYQRNGAAISRWFLSATGFAAERSTRAKPESGVVLWIKTRIAVSRSSTNRGCGAVMTAGYFLATRMQMRNKNVIFAANAPSVDVTKFANFPTKRPSH